MLYRINKNEMNPLQPTTFEQQGLKERQVQDMLKNQIDLVAPDTLDTEDLTALTQAFREGILENFDPEEHGVGRGKKSILPRTFLYLLEHASDAEREDAVARVTGTLARAIETIYDPVEGGFFRYAETRDWQVPHYEKMADLNAGAVLVLYRLDRLAASPDLVRAGERTTEYLRSTLYEPSQGTFLSFQEASTRYFRLDAARRSTATAPAVADKVFTDRLAGTLDHLLDLLPLTADPTLEREVTRAVEFLAAMAGEDKGLRRYFLRAEGRWEGDSPLRDHALVARVLQKASRQLSEPRYAHLGQTVAEAAIDRFFDAEKGIFVDPAFAEDDSAEYLMEMNGLLGLAMMRLGEDGYPPRWELVNSLMTYFSGVGALLEDRLWDAGDWEIMEAYVPYLQAIDAWLELRSSGG